MPSDGRDAPRRLVTQRDPDSGAYEVRVDGVPVQDVIMADVDLGAVWLHPRGEPHRVGGRVDGRVEIVRRDGQKA